MHGQVPSPQRFSMLSCMVQVLLIGVIVVTGIFWLMGGQEWLALVLMPVPEERKYDEIFGPPDNPGWRRTIDVSMPSDAVRDYFLQALGEQGWNIESKIRNSSVSIVYCLKGDHIVFPTIYMEIVNQRENEVLIAESSVFIRTNPELTSCYNRS